MKNFEEEVQYFVYLITDNIQLAKTKKGKKAREEAIFRHIQLDEEKIVVLNTEKKWIYKLFLDEIQDFDFKDSLTKYLVLYYIDKLKKYVKHEITFEELVGIREEPKPVVKNLLEQKKNISEQLKLLRSHRTIPEVQEYIDTIYNDKYASNYIKYLIDKYYYNKQGLIRPEKNGLEKSHKLLLS